MVEQEITYPVRRGDVTRKYQFLGRVSPVDERELWFRVDGRVASISVKEGDTVRAGQVLGELEMSDLLDRVDQARLGLERARTRLASTESDAQALAEAQVRYRMSQITLDQARAQDPSAKVAIAEAEVDKAGVAVSSAQLADQLQSTKESGWTLQKAILDQTIAQQNYQIARQDAASYQYRLQLLAQEVELARLEVQRISAARDPTAVADVRLAELELKQLEDRADFYRLVSPIAGRVMSVSKVPGQQVSAFTPAIIVGNPSDLEVRAEVTSVETLSALQVGMDASVEISDAPGAPFPGRISRIPYPGQTRKDDPAVADKTVRLRVSPPRGVVLSVGSLARITVVLEQRRDVLSVPTAAIRRYQNRVFAVVRDGDRRVRVDLKVGLEGDDSVEVIDGLKEGQVVIAQ